MNGEDDEVDIVDSDSDSLESLSSSESSSMDESEGSDSKNEEAPLRESAIAGLGKLANHALLRYHLHSAQLQKDDRSRKLTVNNRNNPTPTGHKRKRSHTVSTATTEAKTCNKSKQSRKYNVETSADRDAYILQRVLRWEQRGTPFDWQSVARFLHIPVQSVRTRYAELAGVALDTVPAVLIMPNRSTKIKTKLDLSTAERQNEYIIQRIKRWHEQNLEFSWENLPTRRGWSTQATKDRVYELVREGKLDATLVPLESVRKQSVFEPDEQQDKFLLEQVAIAKANRQRRLWHHIGIKMGCSSLAVRRRYIFLTSTNNGPVASVTDSTALATTANTVTQPGCEIIDLTEGGYNNLPPRSYLNTNNDCSELGSYVIQYVFHQSWLLQPEQDLTCLWRQLGVELGIRELEFEQLWQQKLRAIFLETFGATILRGKLFTFRHIAFLT